MTAGGAGLEGCVVVQAVLQHANASGSLAHCPAAGCRHKVGLCGTPRRGAERFRAKEALRSASRRNGSHVPTFCVTPPLLGFPVFLLTQRGLTIIISSLFI